ncbi:hypothetical protein GWK48_10805 [Metallosphaera tengchongensis]|uniref:Thermopsin n=1 Tax=Metallosphaera tengchongensis TaxID=1532350 RepID=A0A6N0NZM1_9CREN|nr:thermopsin family protease [Metallosphaera tengchongensis]QKR00808.1 hypothetical protein GWK48_10805 [Metallosphaera tengchongensis]
MKYNRWLSILLVFFMTTQFLSIPTNVTPVTAQQNSYSIHYFENVTEAIPANYFFFYQFTVPNTSPNATIGVYFTESNISVATAIMTAQQFNEFNSTGIINGNSIAEQNGTLNLDGVLFTEGTYYLVVYAYNGPADVYIYLNVTSSLQVVNGTQYAGAYVTVPADRDISIPLHYATLGSPFNLTVLGASNQTVVYQLIDLTSQSTVFESPPVTITNLSLVSYNYTFKDLNRGIYYLRILNPHPTPAFVYFEYHINPQYVNPYLYHELSGKQGAPTGLASYGVLNQSGTPTPYYVVTSSVMGEANITSILAYNSTAAFIANLSNPYMASLQLNLVLVVVDSNNGIQVYWPQNVLLFLTNESLVGLLDSVLNISGDGATLSNTSITSPNGYVDQHYYYENYLNLPLLNYKLPFSFILGMNETVIQGQGVQIKMIITVLQNGSSIANPTPYTFDTIMIHDPSVEAAGFAVSGYTYTPAGINSTVGHYYDAELVFGGGGNGEVTQFQSLNAEIGLLYYNISTNTYVPFPSYYTFGGDTAEATTNVHVTYLGDGLASLSVGQPDYSYAVPQNVSGHKSVKVSNNTTTNTTTTKTSTTNTTTTKTTTTNTTTTKTTTTSTNTTSSSRTQSSSTTQKTSSTTSSPPSSQSSSGSDAAGSVFLVIIVVIIALGVRFLRRRRRR